MPRWSGLCQCNQTRRARYSRHLAVCVRPAYRGDEWRFTGTGDSVSKLEPFTDIQWRSVLLSLDAAQSYNTVVQAPVNQGAVLDFLICNESLPRSLTYSLNSLRNGLRDLPRNEKILTKTNRLRRLIRQTDVASLEGESLHRYLDGLQIQLAEIDQAIAGVYFSGKSKSNKTD